jgi:hypothetical protein
LNQVGSSATTASGSDKGLIDPDKQRRHIGEDRNRAGFA